MAKPTPLSGFPELLPEQRFVEQQVIDRAAGLPAVLLVAGKHVHALDRQRPGQATHRLRVGSERHGEPIWIVGIVRGSAVALAGGRDPTEWIGGEEQHPDLAFAQGTDHGSQVVFVLGQRHPGSVDGWLPPDVHGAVVDAELHDDQARGPIENVGGEPLPRVPGGVAAHTGVQNHRVDASSRELIAQEVGIDPQLATRGGGRVPERHDP